MTTRAAAAVSEGAAGRSDGPLVVVLSDPETLAHEVAGAILTEALQATRRSGSFALALSGGTTPRRVYELLGGAPFEEEMPWTETEVYWSDERCVDPLDLRSNELMAREALLDHVRVPAARVHPMRCPDPVDGGYEDTGGSQRAEATASAYEEVLRGRGSPMDLVLLGLGEDGHTASLFPGSSALTDRERWVVPVLGASAGDIVSEFREPLWRVTLTPTFINLAASVFFVVSGAAKAHAVRTTLGGGATDERAEAGGAPDEGFSNSRLPARLISPVSGNLCWFLDEEAASELEPSSSSHPTKESS